jgi:NH3-dependent NAD+ synthetase
MLPLLPGGRNVNVSPELSSPLSPTCLITFLQNSSEETRLQSKALASQVGSDHLDIKVDLVVGAMVQLFAAVTGKVPRFRARGGGAEENLALQNIQARLRMVVAFMLAQVGWWEYNTQIVSVAKFARLTAVLAFFDQPTTKIPTT